MESDSYSWAMPPVSTYRVNGPALREIREDRGLTLRQLAQKLGTDRYRHPQGIRKYETEPGGKAISRDYARQIARALSVHVSEFTDAPPEDDEKPEAKAA